MKWINGFTEDERVRQRKNWHRWFAWFPVIVGETPEHRSIKVWFDYVERRGMLFPSWENAFWTYQYRVIKP